MSRRRHRRDLRPTVPPDIHFARVANYDAWLHTGKDLLASAGLIWTRVAQVFGDLQASAPRRQLPTEVVATADGDQAALQAALAALPMLRLPAAMLSELAGHGNSYMLMAGYAVENLLKAICVKRLSLKGIPKIGFGGGPDQIPPRHEYVNFAIRELGDITDDERALLERLSVFVKWAGRYPVDKNPPPIEELQGPGFSGNDHEKVSAFCQRLIEKYESL
jgi:hypothetical protein